MESEQPELTVSADTPDTVLTDTGGLYRPLSVRTVRNEGENYYELFMAALRAVDHLNRFPGDPLACPEVQMAVRR